MSWHIVSAQSMLLYLLEVKLGMSFRYSANKTSAFVPVSILTLLWGYRISEDVSSWAIGGCAPPVSLLFEKIVSS